MKSRYFALLSALIVGLLCGLMLINWHPREVRAASQTSLKRVSKEQVGLAQLALMDAIIKYANKTNEEAGRVYSPAYLRSLELRREMVQAYVDEVKKDSPDIKNVLVKLAETRVAVYRLRRDSELSAEKRSMYDMAVKVAELRLEQAKTLNDPEEQQDWRIEQLRLDYMHARMDFELVRH